MEWLRFRRRRSRRIKAATLYVVVYEAYLKWNCEITVSAWRSLLLSFPLQVPNAALPRANFYNFRPIKSGDKKRILSKVQEKVRYVNNSKSSRTSKMVMCFEKRAHIWIRDLSQSRLRDSRHVVSFKYIGRNRLRHCWWYRAEMPQKWV